MKFRLATLLLILLALPAATQDRLRVLILTGESDLPAHDWRPTTPYLRAVLENTGRFDVQVAEKVPGLTASDLAGYHALVLHYNGPRWGEETERAVEDFIRSGKGMVALHGVSYGVFFGMEFRDRRWRPSSTGDPGWPAYAEMMGATWEPEKIGHGRRHVFKVRWVERDHPISRGLEETFLADDELYHRMDLRPNARVLATAFSDAATNGTGQDEPILWAVPFGRGRVIHFTLGHDVAAMSQPGFISAFARATEWVATGEVTLRPAAADRIYLNAAVVTMNAAGRVVEAVAVRDGRVAAAGTNEEIRKLAAPGTAVIDLRGKAMLPGFYDPHGHFPNSARLALYDVDLNSPPIGKMESIEDILQALRAKAAGTPPGHWVVGRGYDDTLVRENRHPTRRDLDRVSTEHPIWTYHTSGHLGVANSRALKLAGITKDTPQPKGGVIRKDAAGEPTGVFEESLSLVTRHIPALSAEQRLKAICHADAEYRAKGITTTVVASGGGIDDLKQALAGGCLHLRAVAMLPPGKAVPSGVPGERIRTAAVKLFHDGSLQGYTGYLSAPYHRQPEGKSDYRGYPLRSRDELVRLVRQHHRAGRQIAIHGNGDAAIDDILYAYREAQRDFPRADARHRIEHCQTAREDQLDLMKELGVTPSFFVGHVYYWGDRHRDIFLGPARAARISPLASALRRGLRFTVHNDTPVTPVDPLLLVWAAVNRGTRAGEVLGPEQRIPVLDALRAVTSDAAWQNFEEELKGSIEPGKLADFVILDQNPLASPPERLKDIPVLQTIVGGETVYRRY